MIVAQDQLKLALELAYVAPRIGGLLISGERGTGKSTAVRSFSWMMHGSLPVTLPINATDDRIVGGWSIDELMINSRPIAQPGLLEQATETGVLYIDEVNLLEDHIVNLILDAASTGHLLVEREGLTMQLEVSFALIGTMNPEEGYLRPQLLDRFGLMVDVTAMADEEHRRRILETVLAFDDALAEMKTADEPELLRQGRAADNRLSAQLRQARSRLHRVAVPPSVAQVCARIGERFEAAGHRGDYVMAYAARAAAAIEGASTVSVDHVTRVAGLALQHRRALGADAGHMAWTAEDEVVVTEIVTDYQHGR